MEKITDFFHSIKQIKWHELFLALNLFFIFVWPVLGNIVVGVIFIYTILKYGIPKLETKKLLFLQIPFFLGGISLFLDSFYFHIDGEHYIRLLPFLLFPVILLSQKINYSTFRDYHFLISAFLASILILYVLFSSKLLAPTLSTNSIYGDGFLKLIDVHPSYISIYFISGIILMQKSSNKIKLLFLGILIIAVFLSASKINMIYLILYFAIIAFRKKSYISLLYIIIVVSVLGLLAKFTTGGFNYDPISRIAVMTNNLLYKTKDESTSGRRNIWSNSVTIMSKKILLGHGVSYGHYLIRNSPNNSVEKLNAHNQFLQNSINNGLIGLLGLMIYVFGPIHLYRRKIDFITTSLVILISSNMLVENLLDRHWGVMLVAFFMSMIYCNNNLMITGSKNNHSSNKYD